VAADVTNTDAGPLAPRVETTPGPAPAQEPRQPHRYRILAVYGILGPRPRGRDRRSRRLPPAERSTRARHGRRGSRAAAASAPRSRSSSTSRRTTGCPTATSSWT
jgi:hypothetical protein